MKKIIIRAKTKGDRDERIKLAKLKGVVITDEFYRGNHKLPYQANGYYLDK